MKNKIRLALILMLIAILLLTIVGCGTTNDQVTTVTSPYYGGNDGLVAKFEKTTGTSDTSGNQEVWGDESFPINVELQNKGEYTILAHEVKLELKGMARSDYTGVDFTKDNSETIEKVDDLRKEGGYSFVNFGSAKYLNLIGTHYDANIFVVYTYPYETYVNIPQVCYKYDIRDTRVCKVDETKQGFTTGGPFQAGTVTEKYIGKGNIQIEFPIKNVGKGYSVANKNDQFKSDWDEVYFEINDINWVCSARGNPNVARIAHPNGIRGSEEVIIRCTNNKIEQGAAFPKAVTLKLSYYYQDWINSVVRIRATPQ